MACLSSRRPRTARRECTARQTQRRAFQFEQLELRDAAGEWLTLLGAAGLIGTNPAQAPEPSEPPPIDPTRLQVEVGTIDPRQLSIVPDAHPASTGRVASASGGSAARAWSDGSEEPVSVAELFDRADAQSPFDLLTMAADTAGGGEERQGEDGALAGPEERFDSYATASPALIQPLVLAAPALDEGLPADPALADPLANGFEIEVAPSLTTTSATGVWTRARGAGDAGVDFGIGSATELGGPKPDRRYG